MEHLLRLGNSVVSINTLGGKFNWRQGDQVILHREEKNGRQTHACWPVFGVPAGIMPGAIKKMERHGFLRTSELTIISADSTSLSLGLCNTEASRNEALFDQYPFYFIARLDWKLLDENTLRIAVSHQNLSDEPAPADLAWHNYFRLPAQGLLVPDLQGKQYHAGGEPPMRLHRFTGDRLSGQLVECDWSFKFDRPNAPFRVGFLDDGTSLTIDPAHSRPSVDRYQFWMDPTQGRFACFEPLSLGYLLGSGDVARQEVLLSLKKAA